MEPKEALEKAETVCRREGFDKTAATLRRLIPFVEAMDAYWADPSNSHLAEAFSAYRAMKEGK